MATQVPVHISVLDWSKLMKQAFGSNAPIMISYALAAACYQDVFNVTGFFPLLTFSGMRASGKTGAALATKGPVGGSHLNSGGFPANDLKKLIAEHPHQLLVLDEFHQPRPAVLNRIKGIYDGTPLASAGGILCTQFHQAEVSLAQRSMVLDFDEETHSPESKAIQELLVKFPYRFAAGLPGIETRRFKEYFDENKNWLQKAYSGHFHEEPTDRLVANAAVLLTVVEYMKSCAEELPFTLHDLLWRLVDAMRRSH